MMSNKFSQLPIVVVSLTVLSDSEGGRSSPMFDQPLYQPHIVIGDPHQKEALVNDDGVCMEDYLGVRFLGDGRLLDVGKEYKVELLLMYYPKVDYRSVVPGATFTLREGGKVVAFGQIISYVKSRN